MTRRNFLKLSVTAITTLFVGLPSSTQQKEEKSIIDLAFSLEKGLWTLFKGEYYIKNILFASRAAKRIIEKVKEVFA